MGVDDWQIQVRIFGKQLKGDAPLPMNETDRDIDNAMDEIKAFIIDRLKQIEGVDDVFVKF
jgi:hypothetical protein